MKTLITISIFFLFPAFSYAARSYMAPSIWIDGARATASTDEKYVPFQAESADVEVQKQQCLQEMQNQTFEPGSYLSDISLSSDSCHVEVATWDIEQPKDLTVTVRSDFDFSMQEDVNYIRNYFASEIAQYIGDLRLKFPMADFDFNDEYGKQVTDDGKFQLQLSFKVIKKGPPKNAALEFVYAVNNDKAHSPNPDELSEIMNQIQILTEGLKFFYPNFVNVQWSQPTVYDCPSDRNESCIYFRYEVTQ